MLIDLKKILDKFPDENLEQLTRAAADLLKYQFLYFHHIRHVYSYKKIAQHFAYYEALFAALGFTLYKNEDFAYVGILSQQDEYYTKLRLDETIALLLCRLIYEESLADFSLQDGIAVIAAERFLERYETLTKRQRPRTKTLFLEMLKRLQQHGLLRFGEEDEVTKLPILKILPAIRIMVDEPILDKLTDLCKVEA